MGVSLRPPCGLLGGVAGNEARAAYLGLGWPWIMRPSWAGHHKLRVARLPWGERAEVQRQAMWLREHGARRMVSAGAAA